MEHYPHPDLAGGMQAGGISLTIITNCCSFFPGGYISAEIIFVPVITDVKKNIPKRKQTIRIICGYYFPPLNNPGNLFPGFSSAVLLVHHFVRRQAFHDPDFLPADTASPPAPGLWPGPGPGIAGGHGTGGCAGAMRGVRDRKEKLIERKKGPGISKLCPAYHYPNHRIDGLKGI